MPAARPSVGSERGGPVLPKQSHGRAVVREPSAEEEAAAEVEADEPEESDNKRDLATVVRDLAQRGIKWAWQRGWESKEEGGSSRPERVLGESRLRKTLGPIKIIRPVPPLENLVR